MGTKNEPSQWWVNMLLAFSVVVLVLSLVWLSKILKKKFCFFAKHEAF